MMDKAEKMVILAGAYNSSIAQNRNAAELQGWAMRIAEASESEEAERLVAILDEVIELIQTVARIAEEESER